jgi:hypothetical protein
MDTLKRSELLAELNFANEEQARLSEMIALLRRDLDESRLRQLRIELLAVKKRAVRLGEDLSQIEACAEGSMVA